MKTLVVYYSRDGHTKIIAEEIAGALNTDIEEIVELASRKGLIGYLKACKDAFSKKIIEIEPTSVNVDDYDLVIIGTPIWAFTMCSAIRSWLTKYGSNLKEVAFFATMSGQGYKHAFTEMKKLCGKTPIAKVSFIDKKIEKNQYRTKLDKFIKLLSKSEQKFQS